MYIETSSPRRYDDSARLISPVITGKTCIDFYYYMKGTHINELRVYVDKAGQREQLAWHLHGQQGAEWKAGRFRLDGSAVQV